MDEIDELKLLEPEPIIPPCKYAEDQLAECGSRRTFNLADLKGRMGKCVWCENSLKGKQRRWCSDTCARSAQFRCFPQMPHAKMHRLIHIQGFACAGCGESYETEIRAKILKVFNSINRYSRNYGNPQLVSLFHIGNNTGDRWHTDHIVPLFMGGGGIDPGNLQVLCVQCHKSKTIEERR